MVTQGGTETIVKINNIKSSQRDGKSKERTYVRFFVGK